MGTPHQVSNIAALGSPIVKVASPMFIPVHNQLLRHLKRDLEMLQQQLGHFALISGNLKVIRLWYVLASFGHGQKTNSLGGAKGISGYPWQRLFDCHPRRPQKHGQICIKRR